MERSSKLSDIHLSGYMSRTDVRRAVDMANDLGADLAVVTGDFITGGLRPAGPIAIEENPQSSRRPPRRVWMQTAITKFTPRAEDAAERLFAQAGMKLSSPRKMCSFPFRGAPILISSASITSGGAHRRAVSACRCYLTSRPWFAAICPIFCSPTIPTRFKSRRRVRDRAIACRAHPWRPNPGRNPRPPP